MFNMLTNLTKAAAAVVVSPLALVADLATLPASAEDPHRGAFDRTGAMLDAAGDAIAEAVKPTREAS